MMQHVTKDKSDDTKEVTTIEIQQDQTPPLSDSEPSVGTHQGLLSKESHFGPDMSGSEDDEASEVDSFFLEEAELKEGEYVTEQSKYLLPAENVDTQPLRTVDPETHARLEALLEAAGISKLSSKDGKALTDPEVLRTLTSSVSSALDEAAQALHRMRAEQQSHLSTNECARSLAEACGEDVNIRKLCDSTNVPEPNEEGESLLSLACSAGYYELAQVLLAMKANVEDRGIKGDCTPLMEAASGGHVDIVRLLISHGADVDAQSSAGNTPLHYAACGGFTEVVQEIIKANARVEVHNENGHTPLMEAASAGHVEVARILLDNGAGINTHSNEFKESALTLACYKGHLEMVKFLLEAGADQEHKTDEMHTALMEASMDGHVEVARLLLDSGAQVNMPADSFESPLTLAACGGHVDLASLLIERGANIEEVNDEGYTPLMEAAREGHDEMVVLLLSHNAYINGQTEETQETALTLACCGGFLEVADFLIQAGADIELGCSTPLMEAAQEGHLELVNYLLKSNAKVHAQTGTGDTALTYACENGHTDVAEVLLEHGADLEHESEGGRTPLMKAARAGHLCTVQFLIRKGADVNRATTTNDHTVLSLACAGGHLAVVELLLAHGADSSHKLKDGSTMVIEAAKGGHTQVVKLLLEWPNHHLVNSPEHVQLASNEQNTDEPRVPVQGLANIVPPSEPDSQLPKTNFIPNFSGKNPEQVRQNIQKTLAKRCLNGQGEGKFAKLSNTLIAEGLQQPTHDGNFLAELGDEKATEKVEAIINNIMAKELINTTTASKEEQILRKQQILEELQKVERELQEKAQAQLLLSAQQQLEQHQQQLLAQTATKAKSVTQGKGQAEEGKKKADGSSQSQNVLDVEASDLQLTNDITSQLPKELTAITQSLLPHYTEAFLRQNNMLNQNNGAMMAVQENRTVIPGTQSQDVMQSTVTSQMTVEVAQRQQLQVLAQQQQQHLQPLSFPQLQLTAQQQEQLLQHVLSQPSYQQQLSTNQQFTQPRHLLPNTQQQQQQALQTPQSLTQQQQQQFLQQQQQAQHLQQQQPQHLLQPQLNKLKQPANPNNKQPRKLRPNQNQVDDVAVPPNAPVMTSPPPSTPVTPNPSPASPQSLTPLYSSVDVDAETESNHDTALTLACAGGHAELVNLLLTKGSDIEHRDKKGFTPLILAATAGHVDVVEILLDNSADIEAQSERTKDTPLSLACSGGRYEVVELLLAKQANKEHRNVSDYTPLSLAASGGYVNIIKLLLSHGAEINSRTGSKLGISPLMLAAMNGHTAAVKLLLDMGSDINAQIETNRNTALTLACFQGRHEVVSLLVDRKANIEHRAKTGLTPLMEAASGGYVEVGRVLLERGADVNAPPVPSSRDTALTIAADKGHYRFVELLLNRGASVDVKNKKGNSPLWLACNGGHLDVVQLLVSAGADIDSQDNRKVSCLMAAFRKGHVKVVKWMVKHVSQFPSDTELQRYIATVNDKELQKKCQQCMETIVTAKDRQAAEANKNATILLEEIDKERQVEENRKAQAAKKRERRKRKRKEKLEKEKESSSKNSSPEPESAEVVEYNEVEEIVPEELPPPPPIIEIKTETVSTNQEPKPAGTKPNKNASSAANSNSLESKKNKKNKIRDRDRDTPPSDMGSPRVPAIVCNVTTVVTPVITTSTVTVVVSPTSHGHSNHHRERNRERTENRKKKNDLLIKPVSTTAIGDLDEFGTIPDNMKMSEKEIQKLTKSVEKKKMNNVQQSSYSTSDKISSIDTSPNTLSLKGSAVVASPKRGSKKEEGWKEVVRKHSVSTPRSKRVLVPSSAISRVIGRGGCNINAIREVSGAHVEVEKPKGSGDRTITIKGSAESTRQAQALIMALVQEPDKELTEIIARGKAKPPEKAPSVVTIGDFAIGTFSVTSPGSNDPIPSQVYSQSGTSTKSSKNLGGSRASSSSQASNSAKSSGSNSVSQSMIWQNPHPTQAAPSSPRRSPQKQMSSSNQGQTGSPVPGIGDKNVPRQLFPDRRNSTSPVATFTNTTVSYTSSSSTMKIVSTSATITSGRGTTSSTVKLAKNPVPGSIKVLQRPQTAAAAAAKSDPQPLPIVTNHVNSMNNVNSQLTSTSVSTPGDYTPFKNFFNSTYILSKKEDSSDKMNFASVAAAGVVSTLASSHTVATVAAALSTMENKIDPALQAKAPGYKPGRTSSPQFRQEQEPTKAGFRNFQLPLQNETDINRTPGYRGSITGMSPRSNPSTPSGLSPRSSSGTPLELSQHSLSSASSQKEEYSMPNQPMTLPEIKSTLNPNAPDFQLAASNMGPMLNGVPVGMPLNFPPSQSLSGLPSATLQALFNTQQLLNQTSFNSLPPQPGGFIPPAGMNQNEPNFSIVQMASQLSQQMASQGLQGPSPGPVQPPGQGQTPNPVQGFPQMLSRNLSPMPPHPRPNSAPSMSVMQADGPGPIGPPKAPSPMPPFTPPLNINDVSKNAMDDRRVPRPIGGERLHRKAPGPTGTNIAAVGEYGKLWALNPELNNEWTPTTSPLMSSAAIPASVITSSVITGGNMAYDMNSAADVDCTPTDNPDGNSFSDSLPVDPASEANFQSAPVMMPMFPNGVPGHYPVPPMFNPRVGGDNIPSMWNSSMKPPPTEAVETGNTWVWSKQTDM